MKKTHHPKPHKKTSVIQILKAKTFPTHEKSIAWFGVVTLLYVILVISSILFGQTLLAIILILSAVVYYLLSNAEPNKPKLVFGDKAITIGQKKFSYQAFRWYRLFYTPHGLRLELQPLRRLRMPIGLDLGELDADKLIKKLTSHVPWNIRTHENISERLMRWLRI